MKASKLLGQYLKAETLKMNGPMEFTIEDVEVSEFKDEKTGKLMKKLVVNVGDDEPRVLLNAANTKALIEAFSDETDTWVGNTFEAFFDPNVMFGTKKTGGMRVRVKAPF
jgi:hypothetical protein